MCILGEKGKTGGIAASVLVLLIAGSWRSAAAQTPSLEAAVTALGQSLPGEPADFDATRVESVRRLSESVDEQAAQIVFQNVRAEAERIDGVHRLTAAKQAIDRQLAQVLDQRFALADVAGDDRRQAIRAFLLVATELIHLSGRVNYHLRDAILGAAFRFAGQPELREELLDRLAQDGSTIGASLSAPLLIDPPTDNPTGAKPASAATKREVLDLLTQHGRGDVLPTVVQFLREGEPAPGLTVVAAETAIRLGLPQEQQKEEWTEETDPEDTPPEPLTAIELWRMLHRVDAEPLSPTLKSNREALMTWLATRHYKGVGPTGFHTGGVTIRPGDWILMRNASPYNLFTDLAPGLFTHVGVVTLHEGGDGIRRLVLVDLNERQSVIRGTNIEDVLPRPLYYAVLRHEDPAVRQTMADVAASLIGNEMQFDLTFNTSRVAELKGVPLEGKKIHTYCAGLLLLCTQETGRPREEFFPIREAAAGARLQENLKRIGLKIGDEFISPTGPLFARQMRLIHFSEPMYDPGRDVEQRIYDHFADHLSSRVIAPKQTLFQSLRLTLAEASQGNRLLAEALARANDVHPDTDLAAAARAVAVVETLDEIAQTQSGEYRRAFQAVVNGPLNDQLRARLPKEEIPQIEAMRSRHADLARRFQQNQLSRRELTDQLATYYAERGRRQIDAAFFSATSATR